MVKYKSYASFYELNKVRFDVVQAMSAKLRGPKELGKQDGFVLAEAEELEHFFLNGANACTDLMFGLSASVLNAKTNMDNVEGLLYSQKPGNATEKRMALSCDPKYVESSELHNELKDLKDYLERKREDFMSNHYFYKNYRNQK